MAIRQWHEPARDLPVAAEAEALVVGGGPAGVAAAIAAARRGARTVLIETGGALGGMWTLGLQTHATCLHNGERLIVGGIAMEIVRRLAALGAAEDPDAKFGGGSRSFWLAFNPEMMKCILDDMTQEAGARVMLHTMCVGALVEGDRVRGVVTESKSGRRAVLGGVVIDCTGDADVAFFAGAPTVKGREGDGRCQPVTTTFLMGNVDRDRAIAFVEADPGAFLKLEQQARERGEISIPQRMRLGAPTPDPGVTYHNQTRVLHVDATSAEDLTRAEIEGRKQVRQAVAFLRRYVPGFEKGVLLATSSTIGLRESRRIIGEYTLTEDDVLSARRFPDGVARQWYYVDVHNPDGVGLEGKADHTRIPPRGTWYEAPYRCMVPKGREQLLVAGRCISATREALGSCRVTVCCAELGEAAGVAAVMALHQGIPVRRVPGEAVRREVLPPL